jgi:hypothetical protein
VQLNAHTDPIDDNTLGASPETQMARIREEERTGSTDRFFSFLIYFDQEKGELK